MATGSVCSSRTCTSAESLKSANFCSAAFRGRSTNAWITFSENDTLLAPERRVGGARQSSAFSSFQSRLDWALSCWRFYWWDTPCYWIRNLLSALKSDLKQAVKTVIEWPRSQLLQNIDFGVFCRFCSSSSYPSFSSLFFPASSSFDAASRAPTATSSRSWTRTRNTMTKKTMKMTPKRRSLWRRRSSGQPVFRKVQRTLNRARMA